MNLAKLVSWTLLVQALVLLTACIAPPIPEPNQDTLFQTSTLSALSAGDFDGELTIGELKQHGDFGLGTFNALDGEMMVLDGQVFQAKDDRRCPSCRRRLADALCSRHPV
ncbi:MAG: acetolactate decarboxylase [Caldilineaceae bacterium]|nr:acetolactate decarboxylase [Caldilineaceae bacterium]